MGLRPRVGTPKRSGCPPGREGTPIARAWLCGVSLLSRRILIGERLVAERGDVCEGGVTDELFGVRVDGVRRRVVRDCGGQVEREGVAVLGLLVQRGDDAFPRGLGRNREEAEAPGEVDRVVDAYQGRDWLTLEEGDGLLRRGSRWIPSSERIGQDRRAAARGSGSLRSADKREGPVDPVPNITSSRSAT